MVEDFKRKLGNVRTGRATVGLLDTVHVDYYGTSDAAEPDGVGRRSRTAVDHRSAVGHVTGQCRRKSDHCARISGLILRTTAKSFACPCRRLNEERRKQLAKQVHEIAEDHRIAVRNVRHAANDTLKKTLKDKTISEDDERNGLDQVQKLTNTFIGKIDELAKNKESEIMSV